ncbi:MAG: tetratricopeptide repeat protein [Proteobacteria bacterium]|nr:tetratricopeptide repeat protein [Pseudomonadota bacterium]
MALTPETNEAFLREVDEELRRDELARFWKKWGRALVAAIAVGLIAFGAFLWWRDYQAKQAGAEGEKLTAAIEQLSNRQFDRALPALKELGASSRPGYRAVARIATGAVETEKDAAKAAADFAAVAKDEKVAQPLRDLALIRQTTIEFDTLPPDQVIQRLGRLAQKGSPWFGSAGELVAIAHIKAGRPRDAGAIYAAIAADPGVPSTLRSRAAQMASVLGVDINLAALPSFSR